ncbi:MAG: DUF1836 domain-containing protein [Clostridium sp.]|jgi:hypothetical protein|nr:DUF1836 domain-containing protein [Clostridium sp.]
MGIFEKGFYPDNEMNTIPGTVMPLTDKVNPFYPIRELINAAGGLNLSQVCNITGLEGSTIQNWLKRGWLGKIADKKYNAGQVARIIIINALRGCLKLEDIAALLSYISGVAGDTSTDIIEEGALFNIWCAAVSLSQSDAEKIYNAVEQAAQRYEGTDYNRKKLKNALVVMTTAQMSTALGSTANLLIRQLI